MSDADNATLQGDTESQSQDGGSGEGAVNEFLQTLPGELRDNESLASIDSLETLARNYLELSGTKADLEKRIPVVPESPDGYAISWPDGFTPNDQRVKAFTVRAHEIGLTQEQVNAIAQFDAESSREAAKAWETRREQALAAAEKSLQDEWGDKYKENVATAENAIERLTSEEFKSLLKQSGLNNNPVVVHTFYSIGQALSEDQFISAAQHGKNRRPIGEDGKPMLKFRDMS